MTFSNVNELVAKDIMAPTIISVSPETSLDDAMEIIVENSISGLPVINAEGRLVGILSEADRLKAFGTNVHTKDALVADYMTCGVITVDENATLAQVSDLLMRVGIRRLPVLKSGSVVGIISRRDLVRALHTKPNQPDEASAEV